MNDYFQWKAEKEQKRWHNRIPAYALEQHLLGKRNIKYACLSIMASILGYILFMNLEASFIAHIVSIALLLMTGFWAGSALECFKTSGRTIAAHHSLPAFVWKDFTFVRPDNLDKRLKLAQVRVSTADENYSVVDAPEENL